EANPVQISVRQRARHLASRDIDTSGLRQSLAPRLAYCLRTATVATKMTFCPAVAPTAETTCEGEAPYARGTDAANGVPASLKYAETDVTSTAWPAGASIDTLM